jgi:hypothetical protein
MKPSPVIRRSVAATVLDVKPAVLDELKLRCWKEGRLTLYDPQQIGALLKLREHWLKHWRSLAR